MKQVYRYDVNDFYVEPVILQDGEPIPKDCVDIRPPDGLYKGTFKNGEWVEGLTDEEIRTIKNAPQSPTDLDLVKKSLTDLSYNLMMNGVL